MNNELMHSLGPWANHKYIKRYKNSKGKWIYVYAKASTHQHIRYEQQKLNDVLSHPAGPEKEWKNRDKAISAKQNTIDKMMDYNTVGAQIKSSISNAKKKAAKNKVIASNKKVMSKWKKTTPKKNPLKIYSWKKTKIKHSDELSHSAGPWKEHKYVSKHKGKNGKWVYVYKLIDAISSNSGLGLVNKIAKGTNQAMEDIPKMVSDVKKPKPKKPVKKVAMNEYGAYVDTEKPKNIKNPEWLTKPSKKKSTKVALAHSAKGTHWTKENHKYIRKYVNKNGKLVYEYKMRENDGRISKNTIDEDTLDAWKSDWAVNKQEAAIISDIKDDLRQERTIASWENTKRKSINRKRVQSRR